MEERELPEGEEFREEEFADDEGEGDEPLPCPLCGRPIHIEAERCPHCGDYVTPGGAPRKAWPWWMWAGIGLSAAVLALWALM